MVRCRAVASECCVIRSDASACVETVRTHVAVSAAQKGSASARVSPQIARSAADASELARVGNARVCGRHLATLSSEAFCARASELDVIAVVIVVVVVIVVTVVVIVVGIERLTFPSVQTRIRSADVIKIAAVNATKTVPAHAVRTQGSFIPETVSTGGAEGELLVAAGWKSEAGGGGKTTRAWTRVCGVYVTTRA